ncbi:MAG: ribonuclease HI [Desulfosarcinaceae bacterium]|nr:ribonuclease HI [Desulfosarcinaceae bacterium]
MGTSKKKKYYAVVVGRKPGIYTQWFGPTGAKTQVEGHAGALYKGFPTRAEAQAFMAAPPSPRRGRQARSRTATASKFGAEKPPAADQVVVYTDGGATHNPGPGGYGVVIEVPGGPHELSAGYRRTTNNRMELMAAIAALQWFEAPAKVLLHTDSRYVVDGITKGWAEKWRANNWMRTKREAARNADLWRVLLELCDRHTVEFRWVRGHAGIPGNERCDQLSVAARANPVLLEDHGYEPQR